jgi:DNA-binding transcriptional regulator GbsR (MarR family)
LNNQEPIQRFINHFGEMSSRWGFNRTVGRICALLIISDEPLSANAIGEQLCISRGNVSMALKELQSWRLINIDCRPGDRKEYYRPAGSVIEMARIVAEERRKREVDPTLSLVRDILLQTNSDPKDTKTQYALQQIEAIYSLLESSVSVADELQKLSTQRLKTLIKLGNGLGKVINFSVKEPSKSTPTD